MEDIKVTEEKERRKKKSRKVKREKNAGINLCYGMHFFFTATNSLSSKCPCVALL